MYFNKSCAAALCAYAVLLLISLWAALFCEFGIAESAHRADSLWLYVRRALLIACAVGIPPATRRKGVTEFGWRLSKDWLIIAIILGLLIGIGNKGGFDPRIPSAVLLACFHAFATELFFRGYLITVFSGCFERFWPALLLSSALYGIFYLTVWTAWVQPLYVKALFVLLFTALGVLFGYCYKKSGSLLVPWIMHFLGVLQYRMLM